MEVQMSRGTAFVLVNVNLYHIQSVIAHKGPVLDFLNISHLLSTAPSFLMLLSFPSSNLRSTGTEHLVAPEPFAGCLECPRAGASKGSGL